MSQRCQAGRHKIIKPSRICIGPCRTEDCDWYTPSHNWQKGHKPVLSGVEGDRGPAHPFPADAAGKSRNASGQPRVSLPGRSRPGESGPQAARGAVSQSHRVPWRLNASGSQSGGARIGPHSRRMECRSPAVGCVVRFCTGVPSPDCASQCLESPIRVPPESPRPARMTGYGVDFARGKPPALACPSEALWSWCGRVVTKRKSYYNVSLNVRCRQGPCRLREGRPAPSEQPQVVLHPLMAMNLLGC